VYKMFWGWCGEGRGRERKCNRRHGRHAMRKDKKIKVSKSHVLFPRRPLEEAERREEGRERRDRHVFAYAPWAGPLGSKSNGKKRVK